MTRTTSAVRTGAAGLVVALAWTLAGCAGGGSTMAAGQNFTPDQARRFVIDGGDLPSDYKEVESATSTVPCDSGWLANKGALDETANEVAVKQQLLALGAQRCHRSVYEKVVRDELTDHVAVGGFGVLAVVYPDGEAASKALPLFRASNSDPLLRESYGQDGEMLSLGEDLFSPGLGDESAIGIKRAATVHGGGDSYTFIWRVRNVALVLEGGADWDDRDVLRIAENISARAVR